MDGTFSITPAPFYQVYVVLAELHDAVHPFLYVLLSNKTQKTYTRMFSMIKDLDDNIQPEVINCDFEIAAINSIRECFPGAQIAGCYFHLMQNLRKHVMTAGLAHLYQTDTEFAMFAKMIGALAYVPVDDLEMAFEALFDAAPTELEPVLNYFEDTYIGRPNRRGQRRPPLFPHEMWNVHDRTLQGAHRTNNHAEAANRRLQSELNMEHPNLWMFIDALKRSQKNRDFEYEALVGGAAGSSTLKKYEQAYRNILKVVETYSRRSIIAFLRGIT